MGFVGRIYDAALEPGNWQSLVDELAEACSGTAAITTQDPLGVEANIAAANGIDLSFLRSYEIYYVSKRPWARQVGSVAVGAVFTPTTLINQHDFERTEYFNDWLKPQGIYHLCSSAVARYGDSATFLTLSRSRGTGDFGPVEMRLIRTLVPHLQRALELHRRLFTVTQQRDLLTRGLDGLGVGAILVDFDGRMGFANRIAETFLRRGDGLVLRHGRIGAKTQAASNTLSSLIRGAARAGAGLDYETSGGVLALPCEDGRQLHAMVCPLPVGKADWSGRPVPSALMFVADAARNVSLRPADLKRLYGLTRAEAELMCALANGTTLEAYAEAAGISRVTAKTHLQRIFVKTDCHRQSEVVRDALANGIAQIAAAWT